MTFPLHSVQTECGPSTNIGTGRSFHNAKEKTEHSNILKEGSTQTLVKDYDISGFFMRLICSRRFQLVRNCRREFPEFVSILVLCVTPILMLFTDHFFCLSSTDAVLILCNIIRHTVSKKDKKNFV